ncbi:putative reverse transcriptase domain-containing protein [Tanacetum coccineum]
MFALQDLEAVKLLGEASKVENATAEMLRGLYQLMERKEDGSMYFIWVPLIGGVRTLIMDEAHASRLPRSSSGYDMNWVIVDRLTKSAHFLAIREDYKMEKLSRLYIDEIVGGHGVPVSIILNRDGRFTSRYLSFGRHLEELHVTWAHLEKKRTRLRTYTNIYQECLYSGWRRRHKYNVTPSPRRSRRRHHISRWRHKYTTLPNI